MHRKRLAIALATTTAAAGLLTAPSASAEPFVAPGCAELGRANSSELVGGDDFALDTPLAASWDSNPLEAFEARQDPTAGDGWLMHGNHDVPSSQASAGMAPSMHLPAGRRLVLVLTHAHVLTNGTRASVELASEGAVERVRFYGSAVTYFSGTAARRTVFADVSKLAGRDVTLKLRLSVGSTAPGPEQTGWDVDDVAVYTCDGLGPSAPINVKSRPGYGEILTTWEPPGWRPDKVHKYLVQLRDLTDGRVVQTAEVGPEVREWRFTDVPKGPRYRVDVSTEGNYTSGSPVYSSAIAVTSGSLNQTVRWLGDVRVQGTAACDGSIQSGFVALQRRYSSSGAWVEFTRYEIDDGRWAIWEHPTRHTQYRALYLPREETTWACMGSISPTVNVKVKMAVHAQNAGYLVYKGEPAIVKGYVQPAHPGMRVLLQRYYSDGWRTVSSKELSSSSRFTFSMYKKPGRYTYRVVAPGHSDHLQGISDMVQFKVNDFERY